MVSGKINFSENIKNQKFIHNKVRTLSEDKNNHSLMSNQTKDNNQLESNGSSCKNNGNLFKSSNISKCDDIKKNCNIDAEQIPKLFKSNTKLFKTSNDTEIFDESNSSIRTDLENSNCSTCLSTLRSSKSTSSSSLHSNILQWMINFSRSGR